MSDQKGINSLFDFSDLRKKNDEHQIFNKFLDSSSESNENEALLRAFKELRQKLKIQSREINGLKDELKISNIKYRQNQEALTATLTNNLQLKQKIQLSTNQNQELKKKLSLMKETAQSQTNYYQEAQFTKQALLEMKNHIDILEQQREKLMEISLAEKMNFEEEICKLKSKIQSDSEFISELETNFNKARETIIKQQNQIKKQSINFQQEVFNKNWTTENFETQHLLNVIKEMQREVNTLKAKNRKDKEKKVLLEDRIIELQELSGFHNVKADTFEGEIDMITRKYTKLDKKYKESKLKIDKISIEKLEIEQSFNKLILENEEFLKRLKELNISQINGFINQFQNRFGFLANKKARMQEELQNISTFPKKVADNSYSINLVNTKSNNFPVSETANFNNFDERNVLGQHQKGNLPRQKSQVKIGMFNSNMTFGERQNEENENMMIENRIRRQREEMQRKIKEKILHRKLETSSPAEQYKFRGEYIKSFIDRKN